MILHEYDYIFAIAMIFGFLDAFNIGANDVSNSWASSISSRSVTYWQAMILAAICELLGAVLVGSRVSDTIKNKIIDIQVFEETPAVLMLTMATALIGSSIWLTIATFIGMPVSTTHSIVGAVIGAGIAAKGAENVVWGWGGVAQIVASWFIAPLLAGCIAATIYLISKYAVLEVKDFDKSLRRAFLLVPILVFTAFCILTMLIVWKGSPSLGLDKLSTATTCGAIFGVGGVAATLYVLFLYPYYRRKLVHEDWTLKAYDAFRGPAFYFMSTDNIPPMPKGHKLTIDYYEGRRHDEVEDEPTAEVDPENRVENSSITKEGSELQSIQEVNTSEEKPTGWFVNTCPPDMKTKTYWFSLLKQGPKQWPHLMWQFIIHGWVQDVISNQSISKGVLAGDIKRLHLSSKFYDNRIEFMFSILQCITAGTMSFAHGANDIANATGPLSSVFTVWHTGTIGAKAEVPQWILGYAGVALVFGIWTLGYRIISVMGNKLILQSPSRGFALELGAAITTVMATQLSIPVSTTQCAIGATVFIGLCNKDLKSVNWRMVTWCYLGWILTLPIAGLMAGILNGIILYAPHY